MKPTPEDWKDRQKYELLNQDVDFDTIENKKKILQFLSRTSASYLGEIAWESGLSEYTARMVMSILDKEGFIEHIPVCQFAPDKRLLARVADQSGRGQGGYENFSRKRWFGITKGGYEWMSSTS